jgi:pyruvate/2-oxoglutarate dehydrogenase complex dihydrolipoamide dehydrogenase (E3) component
MHTVELGRADLPVGQDARQRVPTKITAKHFIIATGSRVAPSPLPQLNASVSSRATRRWR